MPPPKQPPPKSIRGKTQKHPKTKGAQKQKIVDRAMTDMEALTLRRDGASFPEIAQVQKCSISTAKARVVRKLEEIQQYTQETAEHIKTMMDMRLLRTQLELSAIIRTGSNREKIAAAHAQVAVDARRAALLGLDASAKIDLSVSGSSNRNIDDEIERILAGVERASTTSQIPAVVEVDGTIKSASANGKLAYLGVPDGPGMGEDQERS